MSRARSEAARAYARAPRANRSVHWRAARFAALDFELTGLDLDADYVLSFGIVPIERARVQIGKSVYRVVKPPIEMPAASVAIHGLRPADLEDAPPLERVSADLIEQVSGRALLAHAAWIEVGFLKRLMRDEGIRRLRQPVVDVYMLARRLDSLEGHDWRETPIMLSELAGRHGVPAHRAHHALGDALTTAQLFLVLATKLEAHGVQTVGQLAGPWPSNRARLHR